MDYLQVKWALSNSHKLIGLSSRDEVLFLQLLFPEPQGRSWFLPCTPGPAAGQWTTRGIPSSIPAAEGEGPKLASTVPPTLRDTPGPVAQFGQGWDGG